MATPKESWEEKYRGSNQVWSGKPHPLLVQIAAELPAGSALDLGCGEGADALWLGSQGWEVIGIDISPTAVARARQAAEREDLTAVTFESADLARWAAANHLFFDLVCLMYVHTTSAVERAANLQLAATKVKPGGHLLIVFHGEYSGAKSSGPAPVLPADIEQSLRLPPCSRVLRSGAYPRGPQSRPDTVLYARVGSTSNRPE